MPEAKNFFYFKTFYKDSLADDGTWSDDWDLDTDLVIKRIHLIRKDGASFTDSVFYLKISEDVFTRENDMPAVVLGPDKSVSPELNIPCKAGERVSWTFTNKEGATISLFLVFECWREESRV